MSDQLTPAQEREAHINMMQRPADWPAWPCLPLKRHNPSWEAGVMLEIRGTVRSEVYLANMFAGVGPDTPKKEYDSFADVYDDGWRVD